MARPSKTLFTAIGLSLLVATAAVAGGGQENADTTGGNGGAGEASETAFGVIEYLEGEVTVDGTEAQIGTRVDSGQIIDTGPNAYAEIIFNEKNIFQLRKNTTLRVTLDEKDVRRAELERGSFAAVFDRIRQAADGGSFEIRTPTAIGGVRGTTFFVHVENEESTYVCTCNGATELSALESPEELRVNTGYHAAYRFIDGGDEEGVYTEQATLVYHTDEEMNELAAKVDVTIPWER